MDSNGTNNSAPKTNKEEQEKSSVMTKEEIAKAYQEYYEWLDSIYPLPYFKIEGKNREILTFYHGYNFYDEKDKPQHLIYYLIDAGFSEFEAKRRKQSLNGIEPEENREYKAKASIIINKEDKTFNFMVEFDDKGNGYGRAIYQNYLSILEMLGIEEKENYELQVSKNSHHDFFKTMHTEELVARTNGEPNLENARAILQDFAKYPNAVLLRDINAIAGYAIKSNVPMEEIAKAINENGFNLLYSTMNDIPQFNEKELEQFKSFHITGLKATRMHEHFNKGKNFKFMLLMEDADIDTEDTTLEFRKIFEEIKKDHEERKEQGRYISPNLEEFGELEHLILDWVYAGLFFKRVSPEIQALVKKQAIEKFEEFDPEHKKSWSDEIIDSNSARTFRVLSDAGLLDKDAYLALYQKALNRNYDLEEFDCAIYRFIDSKSRKEAREEIAQNMYCPYPKKKWQKSSSWGENHRIAKVTIPQAISKKGNVRELLKQEIVRQGIARKTKIKTDMTGIGRDKKPFFVDNLKDWFFGVPGAHGNMQMMGNTSIAFPPQTPKLAIEMIEKALNNLVRPDIRER